MAGIPSGSDPGGYDLGDFGMVGDAVSDLVNRTQGNVEAFYKAQVQASGGWGGASSNLFAGLFPDGETPFPLLLLIALAEQIFGFVPTSGSVIDLLVEIGNFFSDKWQDLVDAIEDFADFLVGLVGFEDVDDAVDYVQDGLQEIQDWFSGFVAALTGLGGTWTRDDATQVATDQADTIAQLSAAVAALQALYGQSNTNAFLAIVDFSQFGNSTNLPSIFTQVYSASPIYGGSAGTGTYGVTSGRARVAPVNNNPRKALARYNVGEALTDYQIAGGVWTSLPEDDGFGNRGYDYLTARVNSSQGTCIYARFAKTSVQLGCTVSGTTTVFTTRGTGGTGTFSMKNNTLYYLLAGTPGGVRSYEVREGSPTGPVILAHTEIGTTSQFGASYRSGGLGVEWYASVFGSVKPGHRLYWIFGDNTTPSSLGVVFRAYRTSTGTANAASDENTLPDSWFGVTERITSDMTYASASENELTVNTTGTYAVTVSQSISAGILAALYFRPLLYKNNSRVRHGQHTFYPAGASFRVVMCSTWQIYLTAGDVIKPGYWASSSALGALCGEASGSETFWEVALVNRSAA